MCKAWCAATGYNTIIAYALILFRESAAEDGLVPMMSPKEEGGVVMGTLRKSMIF